MEKVILKANDGMILTDGVVYGVEVSLAVDRDPNEFHQITLEEYQAILAQQEANSPEAIRDEISSSLV